MNLIHKRPGRPPDVSAADVRALKNLLATGVLSSTRAVQSYLSRKVLGSKSDHALSLKTARKYMRLAGCPPKFKTSLALPKQRIRELKKCPRALQQLIKPILEVAAGVPVRESARNAKIDQRTLRYRFCRVRDKGLRGLSLPHGKFMEAFFDWCDQEKKPTVKGAVANFGLAGKKSARTYARYIMDWKDQRGIRRRHWSSGGSKHSGMAGYGS